MISIEPISWTNKNKLKRVLNGKRYNIEAKNRHRLLLGFVLSLCLGFGGANVSVMIGTHLRHLFPRWTQKSIKMRVN